jgi:hypothetical protein
VSYREEDPQEVIARLREELAAERAKTAQAVAMPAMPNLSPLVTVVKKSATKFRRTCGSCAAIYEYGPTYISSGMTNCPECQHANMHYSSDSIT